MNKSVSLVLIFIFFTIIALNAQKPEEFKKRELTGMIIDYNNKPIKGVRIFVDSLKTNVKTNKKGFYKVILSSKPKLITAFSPDYGLIDVDYKDHDKINFIFPEDNSVLTKREFAALGYGASSYNNTNDYSSYRDILQLLRTKFPNVEVIGENIRIKGTGLSVSAGGGGYNKPLFIVNGSQVSSILSIAPASIKSISVERGNTSLYGSRGAGGVVKIKLK